MAERYDVAIVGGAVTGSSVAYHLAAHPGFGGSVLVLEQDPSYAKCASALSASSIRQQFSTAINIRISLYGIRFLRAIGDILEVDGDKPSVQLHEGGYLFLATSAGQAVLAENHALQTSLGADIAFLPHAGLAQAFPWLHVGDLAAGTWGRSGEGWFDGYGLMQAFRRKARSLGVVYRAARAAKVERRNNRVESVVLADGTRIACGAVVNAAGAGARALAASAGIDIPVHAKKRMVFTFACRESLARFPLLIDPSGVYVRPEGDLYLCGSAPPPEDDPDADGDFDVDHRFFDDHVWPTLAHRVPAFEAIKPGRAWAGHYDMNLFDHNAIVGPAPELPNFHFANGFSGHGLQQSPAIGRGVAELIVDGGFHSLDLSPLSFSRLLDGRKVAEKNVV